MSATDYLEGKLLDHILGVAVYTPPAALYLAMHTADPLEGGTTAEVVGGSYARQLITFSAQVSSQSPSSNTQTFTNMPGVTVTHFTIRDAVTGGNSLFVGTLQIQRTVTAGDPLSFSPGQIVVLAD